MSQIELLMKELNLSPDTIKNTLSKINEAYQCEDTGKFCFMGLNGNGDGNGNGNGNN